MWLKYSFEDTNVPFDARIVLPAGLQRVNLKTHAGLLKEKDPCVFKVDVATEGL